MTDIARFRDRVADLVARLSQSGLTVATAESCTGGLVIGLLTEIAGSSAVVDRGFITYSNEAKTEMLGVPAPLIDAHGAVSRETAEAMAARALSASRADMAVAITGIAGPGGGTPQKPVGLVHFAAMRRGRPLVHVERRFPDRGRDAIRADAIEQALDLLSNFID